jgi:NAD/NADP transhydrogenase beta subunit
MKSQLSLLIDIGIILVLLVGVRQFRTPRGARRGNLTAAASLALAMGVIAHRYAILRPEVVVASLLVGSLAGLLIAMRVKMIQIPSMVAFQHGAGGVAAFLVAYVELIRGMATVPLIGKISGVTGLIVGAATFSGSMIASAKLAGRIKQTPTVFRAHNPALLGIVTAIVLLGSVVPGVAHGSTLHCLLLSLVGLSILLGYVFSIRIGGADMPVLISFLNATAGLAAAFCGVIIGNRLLIACGATVAASGSILTHVMCKAMNRSLINVFVGIRQAAAPPDKQGYPEQAVPSPRSAGAKTDTITEPGVDEAPESPAATNPMARAVNALGDATDIIIIPGYGMALAQAQFKVVELTRLLEGKGKKVKFAIHPVAGRMPGHMNVLLAEADVPYDQLYEMDDINGDFEVTDVALIVGACDVVNPAAVETNGTPISGMPILKAYVARNIVVCNLDEKPGYSGVENSLYRNSGTIMLLGNAKNTIQELIAMISGGGEGK